MAATRSCWKRPEKLKYYLGFVRDGNHRTINCGRAMGAVANYTLQINVNHAVQCKNLLNTYNPSETISRNKSSKGRKTQYGNDVDSSDDDEEEDDKELEDEDDEGFNSNIKILKLKALRLDYVLKTALGFSRKKMESFFYHNKIRINKSAPNKKSLNVAKGDEIDLIHCVDDEKLNTLKVGRVKILEIEINPDTQLFVTKVWRSKSLTVPNYTNDVSWRES